MHYAWRFPKLDGGNIQGYSDQGIESFKGEDLIDNLAREVCQNSLDARDESVHGPVLVSFNVIHLKTIEHGLFVQYEEIINSCRAFWASDPDKKIHMFLEGARRTLSENKIPTLVISDFSTHGLRGSKKPRNATTEWRALTHSDGTSVKDDTSGGSYGIGKNATFAASSLSMVLYNTYATDGERAFQGVARLATLIQDNEETQRVGHYLAIDDKATRPIYGSDKGCPIRDLFWREKYGTDLIIPGFYEKDWTKRFKIAVLRHFFIAIHQKKLVVQVGDETLDHMTIDEHFSKLGSEIQLTLEMYTAYRSPDNNAPFTNSILENDDICFFIKEDQNFHRNTGFFRKTGMLIFKQRKNVLQHYSGVVLVTGDKLNSLLRDTEPAKHNKWDPKVIPNSETELRDIAQNAVNMIFNWINEIIASLNRSNSETAIDSDVGEYLPDDVSESFPEGQAEKGEDILKEHQKAVNKVKLRSPQYRIEAGPSLGDIEKDRNIHNESKSDFQGTLTPQVGKAGTDSIEGVGPGSGSKTMDSIKMIGQRIVCINEAKGLYRIIIIPEVKQEHAFLELRSVGEDGSGETLMIENFIINGTELKNHRKQERRIGPIMLEAQKRNEIIATIEQRERMQIALRAYYER